LYEFFNIFKELKDCIINKEGTNQLNQFHFSDSDKEKEKHVKPIIVGKNKCPKKNVKIIK
jgi:hypothetical protein